MAGGLIRGIIILNKSANIFLYDHKAFCSERCVHYHIRYPNQSKAEPADWEEYNWKIERKIDRGPRKLKNKF